MEVLIITGMSGAGKSAILNLCQDNEYYTLDNLPPKLIFDVIELLKSSKKEHSKLALVIDIRGGEFFADLYAVVDKMKKAGIDLRIIYADASDRVLLNRYKELRRPHPHGKGLTIEGAIQLERAVMDRIKNMADFYIDTSNLSLAMLKMNFERIIVKDSRFLIQFVSFGFKRGILEEADFVFDVRFSENPFYYEELKEKNGKDKEVKDFVLAKDEVVSFIDKVEGLIKSLVADFEKQAKPSLVIGIGCTGGKHRSVVVAEELLKRFEKTNYKVEIHHRDQNMW